MPRSHRGLTTLFGKGRAPEPDELEGEYFVDMLTVLPSLRRLGHRKVFQGRGGAARGHNVLLRNLRWGSFELRKGICAELGGLDVLIIDYAVPGNGFITRRIRDHVRCLEPGALYLGRFYYTLLGKPRFLGYFSLSR